MPHIKFTKALWAIFISLTILGLDATEAKQVGNLTPYSRDVGGSRNNADAGRSLGTNVSDLQLEAFKDVSSRRNQVMGVLQTDVVSVLASNTRSDESNLGWQPKRARDVVPIPVLLSQSATSTSSAVFQPVLPAATKRTSYSFQRDGIPTLEQRRVIRNTPIEFRPHRPFHFYGNAVRRRGRN